MLTQCIRRVGTWTRVLNTADLCGLGWAGGSPHSGDWVTSGTSNLGHDSKAGSRAWAWLFLRVGFGQDPEAEIEAAPVILVECDPGLLVPFALDQQPLSHQTQQWFSKRGAPVQQHPGTC